MKIVESIFITGIKTVAAIHLKLALSHLLGLLDLVLGELDGCGLVGLLLLCTRGLGLLVLVSLLRLLCSGRLLGARLLSDLAFHEIDRVLLQLFADLLFFPLPLSFKLVRAVSLVL